MILKQSERKSTKIKMAIQGPSGAGKSYSALLLAKGLVAGDMPKVAVIDTENGSANLYAYLGDFNVLQLNNPFSPERYIQAITACEKAGMKVIIIDSISHCWEFLLQYHSTLGGNSFTNWGKVTLRQNEFVDKILRSNCHIIATMRTKQGYVLNQKEGKYVPQKIGLKAVQRDGVDYEFTLVFDIDIKHHATVSKDRTGLFVDKHEFIINSATGRKILGWCNGTLSQEELKLKVDECSTIAELNKLYNTHGELSKSIRQHFITKRNILNNLTNPNNHSLNGTTPSYPKS